ncbi:uncharacterized protein [Coffea arabica]|uniref:Uncharacterized protein n=1 Tax=Coffea arabica TaxID=13443 RepID=A0ABM4VN82_COFAR
MTSHFRGSDTIMIMAFLAFLLFLEIPVMAGGSEDTTIDNPIAELSTREELVHMAGYGEEKLSTVTISGKLLCHACADIHDHHHQANQLDQPLPAPAPVSGASVAVFCGTSWKSRKSCARGTTDEYGDFLIDLPSHLHAIPNLEKVCLVRVLHLSKNSDCRPAFTGKHRAIRLLSIEDGSRAYTVKTIHLTTKHSKSCRNVSRNSKDMIHVYYQEKGN